MATTFINRARTILDLERIDAFAHEEAWRGVYTLGIASRPALITVSCQQNRAADFVRSISEILHSYADKAPAFVNVAIIGGGITGLTLGLLFQEDVILKHQLKTKFRVRLFEKHNLLCPIQRGCSVRRLHPFIHEWPFSEALINEFSFSEYNIRGKEYSPLYWKADNADEVSKNIVSYYFSRFPELFVKDIRRPKLDVWQDVSYLHVGESENRGRFSVVADGGRICTSLGKTEKRNEQFECDIVIFATGFGAEDIHLESGHQYRAISYWRNDDRSQASLYGQAGSYIVSGPGDGGLTDVLRLKLLDYQQDKTVFDLFPLDHEARMLLAERLVALHLPRNIAEKASKKSATKIAEDLTVLINSLQDIREDFHEKHFHRLLNEWNKKSSYGNKNRTWGAFRLLAHYFIEPRLRSDVSIILRLGTAKALGQSEAVASPLPIERVVGNKYAAFYNRVLIFMVWKLSGLKVVQSDTISQVQTEFDVPDARVIIRHGVNTIAAIQQSMSERILQQRNLSSDAAKDETRDERWRRNVLPDREAPDKDSTGDRYRSGRRVFGGGSKRQ